MFTLSEIIYNISVLQEAGESISAFAARSDVELAIIKLCTPELSGNTFIQGVGNGLCRFGVVPVANTKVDENVFNSVKNLLRDEDAKVYFVENIPYYEFKEYNGEK